MESEQCRRAARPARGQFALIPDRITTEQDQHRSAGKLGLEQGAVMTEGVTGKIDRRQRSVAEDITATTVQFGEKWPAFHGQGHEGRGIHIAKSRGERLARPAGEICRKLAGQDTLERSPCGKGFLPDRLMRRKRPPDRGLRNIEQSTRVIRMPMRK